jgi:hypothetical protein
LAQCPASNVRKSTLGRNVSREGESTEAALYSPDHLGHWRPSIGTAYIGLPDTIDPRGGKGK